jgi:hypothetical protein
MRPCDTITSGRDAGRGDGVERGEFASEAEVAHTRGAEVRRPSAEHSRAVVTRVG